MQHVVLRFILLATVLILPGCSESGPKLYPVQGTVSVNGKPAEHALVFLHRKGRTDQTEQVPYGKADAEGKFKISTAPNGVGAVPGEYLLTVVWPDMSKPENSSGQRPDVLRGAYEKAGESKLSATVEAKENTLAPINLTLTAAQGTRPPPRTIEDK